MFRKAVFLFVGYLLAEGVTPCVATVTVVTNKAVEKTVLNGNHTNTSKSIVGSLTLNGNCTNCNLSATEKIVINGNCTNCRIKTPETVKVNGNCTNCTLLCESYTIKGTATNVSETDVGLYVAISVPSVVLVIVIICIVCCCCGKKKNKRNQEQEETFYQLENGQMQPAYNSVSVDGQQYYTSVNMA